MDVLFKEGSPIGVSCGTAAFWVLFAAAVLWAYGMSRVLANHVSKLYYKKEAVGYQFYVRLLMFLVFSRKPDS